MENLQQGRKRTLSQTGPIKLVMIAPGSQRRQAICRSTNSSCLMQIDNTQDAILIYINAMWDGFAPELALLLGCSNLKSGSLLNICQGT